MFSSKPELGGADAPGGTRAERARVEREALIARLEKVMMSILGVGDTRVFRKFLLAALGVVAAIVGSFWVFRESIIKTTSKVASDMAARTLESQHVQQSTQEIIGKILTDKKVQASTLEFVRTVLAQPQTQKALVELTKASLQVGRFVCFARSC
jgi:citrate lyase synthetase